jgi:hypothetical protein
VGLGESGGAAGGGQLVADERAGGSFHGIIIMRKCPRRFCSR